MRQQCIQYLIEDMGNKYSMYQDNYTQTLPKLQNKLGSHRSWFILGSYHKMIYLFHILNVFIIAKSIRFSKIKMHTLLNITIKSSICVP